MLCTNGANRQQAWCWFRTRTRFHIFAFLLQDKDTWYSWKPEGLWVVIAYKCHPDPRADLSSLFPSNPYPAPSQRAAHLPWRLSSVSSCCFREETTWLLVLITLYFSVFNFISSFSAANISCLMWLRCWLTSFMASIKLDLMTNVWISTTNSICKKNTDCSFSRLCVLV